MLNAYTDAGHYGEYSLHSYIVKDGKYTILRGCKIENVSKTTEAEAVSIKLLLEQCLHKGVRRVCIHTDSQGIVRMVKTGSKNGTIQKIIALLIETDSNIKWVSRKNNKTSHKICEDMKRVLDTYIRIGNDSQIDFKNHVYLRRDRTPNIPHRRGWINPYNLTVGQRSIIINYYNSLVVPSKRHPISHLFEWGTGRMTSNTRKGRLHFVERYVSRFHTIDELQMENGKDIFGMFHRESLEGIQ